MTELAAGLSEQQLATRVPALPAWTVRDTYAHLAGVAAEVLDGTLTRPPLDAATARQVADRAERGIAEVCAEWDEVGAGIEKGLAGEKGHRYYLLVQDAWNHEQDILGALGMPQKHDDPTTAVACAVLVDVYARAWEKFGLGPAVRLRTPSFERVIGAGEPTATLQTTDFELLRMLIGRRTREEMREAGWDEGAPPDEVLERLHSFPVPEKALGE